MTEENEPNKYTTISIPAPLAAKIKKRIEGTGFNSLSSYVISGIEEGKEEEAFSKEDEEKVKERLRALGYLD